MAKTPIDKLKEAAAKILSEYGEAVGANCAEVAEKLAKKGAQTLKAVSREKFGNGDYAKGWAVDTKKTSRQLDWTSTIYNKSPGLPHLLEYGHVTRNGTGRVYPRTPAHEHIKPVEDELIQTYESEVKAKL